MTGKVLKENEGECVYVLRVGKDFFNIAPEAQTINEKINTLDYMKIVFTTSLLYIKDILNRVKNITLT